jgi:hypothetical protein
VSIQYADLTHRCDLPDMSHLPNFGERHQVMARWRCPECGTRWAYAASFLHYDRMYWERTSKPSRKWRKAEAQRLAALEPTP